MCFRGCQRRRDVGFSGFSGVLVGLECSLLRPLPSLRCISVRTWATWYSKIIRCREVTCCISELGYGGLVVVLLSSVSRGSTS